MLDLPELCAEEHHFVKTMSSQEIFSIHIRYKRPVNGINFLLSLFDCLSNIGLEHLHNDGHTKQLFFHYTSHTLYLSWAFRSLNVHILSVGNS